MFAHGQTTKLMKFLLGTKGRMTQYFSEDGKAHAATVVTAGPVTVTQIKQQDRDGYVAIQVGFGTQKASRLAKPQLGHLKQLGPFKVLKEFRVTPEYAQTLAIGSTLDVALFDGVPFVEVTGISKGKGFQGVVKRHGFGGGRRSHGQKHSEREAGSIGGGGRAGGRVAKGMRMAGRMGSDTITIKNLSVLAVDPTTHTLLIKGAVPGKPGTLLEITA
jgi:large subunit ribosomal protein L3